MSGKSNERSNLVDITYSQLHEFLSGQLEGTSPKQVVEYLTPRVNQLKSLRDPFGKPSDASRKRIQSGSVTLSDGVVFRIEDADKEFILAISDAFKIDEVSAFILLRSFMYNQGLPSSEPGDSLVQACIEAITPFYLSERLSVFRVLIPLFRAKEDPSDPAFEVSTSFLPQILSDGPKFVESLLAEYTRKDFKEQLVLLEVLFWTMWGSVSCDGSLVEKILSAAFSTNLGNTHVDANIFFDNEAKRIEQDIAVLWNLITIEIFELETLVDPDSFQISDTPSRSELYHSSPSSLKRIHELVLKNDSSQFVCTHLAWAFVLYRVTSTASEMSDIPDSYRPFLDSLIVGPRPIYNAILETCLRPDNGLFSILFHMLTASPFFVSVLAFKADSSITDSNVIAFRSVFKGLVLSLLDMTSVETIPDFDGFVEVWIALFGRSESQSVAAICRQYWQFDWQYAASRRAIFDVARSRFPIQVKPLIRLTRAMTGSGFLDTDPLCSSDDHRDVLTEDRTICDSHVFYFINSLPTYAQVIQSQACTGAHATYEKVPDRSGSSSIGGLSYTNVRPIHLPGGSLLPPSSVGRALNSEGGEYMAICWNHTHSGWKLMLQLLTDFINRRDHYAGSRKPNAPPPADRHSPLVLSVEDAGVETEGGIDESLITDVLDLIRSVVQDNPDQAEQLMESLETPTSASADPSSPDLVQLTMTILEETFSTITPRSVKTSLPTALITSALSVLSAILTIPRFSTRVWIYLRSTSVLFGTGRTSGSASVALAAERARGRYTMTHSVSHLVQQLFNDATTLILPDNPDLKRLKSEVLLNALKFVHGEIWIEHLGWRYANVSDRFDIGRRLSSVFVTVLRHTPHDVQDGPFPDLSTAVLDLLLFKASNSTISPLVSSVAAGRHMVQLLYQARRKADVRRVVLLLESKLELIRLLLNRKRALNESGKLSLLEQMLCTRVSDTGSADPSQSRAEPIDILAAYVAQRDVGAITLSSVSSAPAIVGHLSNPEATAATFVRIVQHPYDDLALRFAVWNFISLAMNAEPALAKVFVSGQVHASQGEKKEKKDVKGKGKAEGRVAKEALENWEELWELNPQLLCAVIRFLDVTWQHNLEHKAVLEELRKDSAFWTRLSSLSCRTWDLYQSQNAQEFIMIDNVRHSSMHETISMHCYRTALKAYGLHIIALDIGQTYTKDSPAQSESFKSMASRFRNDEDLMDLFSEAVVSSYRPELFDELETLLKKQFPGLSVAQLQSQDPLDAREYGDRFSLSPSLLQSRLKGCHDPNAMEDPVDVLEQHLLSINLNQSLSHSQLSLTESAYFLLQKVAPYLRADQSVRHNFISLAAALSSDMAMEKRQGDMVATIHGKRLSVLLGVLEVAWFAPVDKPNEIESFVQLLANVRGIVLNEFQRPLASLMGSFMVPFHRALLQIIYFCVKNAIILFQRSPNLSPAHRWKVTESVDASLEMVINGLHVVFTSAPTRRDLELDLDMELLVSVFEQCTRSDISKSSTPWLTKCQQHDVIDASLQLFSQIDLVGLSDINLLVNRRMPLYVPHLLLFHTALASIPSAAEVLAGKGLLAAYINSAISPAVSAGLIDTTIPELSRQRSPAHYVYCSMISIVSGVISSLDRQHNYFGLYSGQIARALSWSVGDEIEQVVHLSSVASHRSPVVEKTLRFFTPRALHLLQQLASLFEPVTEDEELLRPLVVHLLHRLYRLASNIVRAYTVLLGDEEDWPIQEALIIPHSKVVLDEPASLGTLLELGNSTLDTLRELVNHPAGQSLVVVGPVLSTRYGSTLNVKQGVKTARRNLEAILVYTITQLAMWLLKPDFDASHNDMDTDDMEAPRQEMSKDRRGPRSSMTVADRLRRGMTGEMAADLKSLLDKAKPVIKKSDDVLNLQEKRVDLTDVLSNFLRERITLPS
ncbi:hypothetical protein BDZ89DRAFT_1064957 [Hymenopellis radicata]|nr:hypothetical protein BDZ89DRAFT_1064957 [Hymenopellis radicata]